MPGETVDRSPAAQVRRTAQRSPDGFAAMTELVIERVASLPGILDGDAALTDDIRALGRVQFSAVRDMLLRAEAGMSVAAAPGTGRFVRSAARRDVPVELVLRICQIGHETVWRWWMDTLQDAIPDSEARLGAVLLSSELMMAYTDALLREVADEHSAEREVWLGDLNQRRHGLVRSLLAGTPPGPRDQLSAQLGYELAGRHTGLLVWPDDDAVVDVHAALERTARACAANLGSRRPLLIAADPRTLWVWVHTAPGIDAVAALARGDVEARVAVGEAAAGVDGFRSSLADAQRAQAVALRTGLGPVVHHREVAALSVLEDDADLLAGFATRQLGALAGPGARNARLRHTLRTYLRYGSVQSTAAELGIHRNTLNRRLEAAATSCGGPVTPDRRLALALALEIVSASSGDGGVRAGR